MQASPGSDRATRACDVRRVVSECSTVLLVAVKTAVTFWQPALRDDRGGSPFDPQRLAAQPREVFCAGQQWLLGPVSPGSGAVISTLAQLASPTGRSVDQMEHRRSRWCGHGGS